MKHIIVSFILTAAAVAFAQILNTEPSCKAKQETNGTTSYVCSTKESKSKPTEAAVSGINSEKEAKEAYALMKTTDAVIFKQDENVPVKSCLATLYNNQMDFHKKKGTYASKTEDLDLKAIKWCTNVDITSEFASKDAFKMMAKKGFSIWTVDQTKTITQIQ